MISPAAFLIMFYSLGEWKEIGVWESIWVVLLQIEQQNENLLRRAESAEEKLTNAEIEVRPFFGFSLPSTKSVLGFSFFKEFLSTCFTSSRVRTIFPHKHNIQGKNVCIFYIKLSNLCKDVFSGFDCMILMLNYFVRDIQTVILRDFRLMNKYFWLWFRGCCKNIERE